MNRDQIKGGFEEAKGNLKEGFGRATNDPDREASGTADRISGKIRKGVGNLKETVREGVDKVLGNNTPGSRDRDLR